MAEMRCNACEQPIVKAPTRCFGCKGSIVPGQAFHFQKERGLCQPLHEGCTLAGKPTA